MEKAHKLTKSRYLYGLQCLKKLWLSIHQPELAAQRDENRQYLFDVGIKVGEYARRYFPQRFIIEDDLLPAIEATTAAVAAGAETVCEAAFSTPDLLCRVDIIKKVPKHDNLWDLYEAKSATRVKEYHVYDLAIQKYCMDQAGYPVRRTYVLHLNTDYVRHGEINPQGLFVCESVTRQVRMALAGMEERTAEMLRTMAQPECPGVEPGPHCERLFTCDFYHLCHPQPEPGSVVEFFGRDTKYAQELAALGITQVKDIPDDFPLPERKARTVWGIKRRQPYLRPENIKRYLDQLEYPLYYFDFETINPRLPPFDNTSPAQTVPFQFSLHIQAEKGGPLVHREFLPVGPRDPRPELVKCMVEWLGERGTIVAYYMAFEKSVIVELAKEFPRYRKQLQALLPRFWDAIVPFQHDYIHPDTGGSASLKAVLPVLVPSLSYKALDIQDGLEASRVYETYALGFIDETAWRERRAAMLAYCRLDTLGMVELVRELYRVSG
jgi:hypothetical protein